MYRVPDLGGRTNAQAQPASGQAFDEGAEMSTITINAWECHRADCEKGYPLFADRKDIGPTHGIRMKDPVNLRSFHSGVSKFHHMVLVH